MENFSTVASSWSFSSKVFRTWLASPAVGAELSLYLFRTFTLCVTGWKWSFKFATQEECSNLLPFCFSVGIFEVMVSAYSDRATSGLVSHSQVNGCSLFKIFDGTGASFASPYRVTKLRRHCCHYFTPWGLVGDFAKKWTLRSSFASPNK